MTRTPLFLAIAIIASPVAAWDSDGSVSIANRGEPVITGVVFNGAPRCDDVTVFVAGNASVRMIGLAIDGTSYAMGESFEAAEGIRALNIDPDAIRALKSGKSAVVGTDQGELNISLRGSRAALDSALAACRRGE